jgi:hypothetical protein
MKFYLAEPGAPADHAADVPFKIEPDGSLTFIGSGGRTIDFGYRFDARGFRVYFGFTDSGELNTIAPAALREWARVAPHRTPSERNLRIAALKQCRLCERLNQEWERAGSPVDGLPAAGPGR